MYTKDLIPKCLQHHAEAAADAARKAGITYGMTPAQAAAAAATAAGLAAAAWAKMAHSFEGVCFFGP